MSCVTGYVSLSVFHFLSYLVENVQKRWKALRERFAKEHKRRNPTGTGTDEVKKEWLFYQNLLFLSDFVKHRKYIDGIIMCTYSNCVCFRTVGNMSCIDLSSTNDQDSSPTPSSSPAETTPECEEITKEV